MSRQLHFFDTIGLSEPELVKESDNAIKQEEKIYRLFQIYKQGTPSQIMKRYDKRWPSVPITSIRRAMNVLTKEGKLIMTDQKFTGLYGKPEHLWRINK